MLLFQGFQTELHSDQCNRYLIASIGSQYYAMNLLCVQEVVDNQYMKFEWCVCRMMNLHGKVIPVVDARTLLNVEPVVAFDKTYTIVAKHNQELYGLIVDDLDHIRTILMNDICMYADNLLYEDNIKWDGIYSDNSIDILMFDFNELVKEYLAAINVASRA